MANESLSANEEKLYGEFLKGLAKTREFHGALQAARSELEGYLQRARENDVDVKESRALIFIANYMHIYWVTSECSMNLDTMLLARSSIVLDMKNRLEEAATSEFLNEHGDSYSRLRMMHQRVNGGH